jgi:hypothetical protein
MWGKDLRNSEKPALLPLCPHKSHGADMVMNLGHCVEKLATNHLSCGMATFILPKIIVVNEYS